MTLVFASSGESRTLDLLLNKVAQEDYMIGLFSNSWLPLKSTVIGDLTEVTGGGYAKTTMPNPSSWLVAASNANGLAQATYPQRSWIFTASIGNVNGMFFVGSTSGRYIYGEKFGDGPYAIVRSGDTIVFTPNILVNSI
jgi:hypothetical protein